MEDIPGITRTIDRLEGNAARNIVCYGSIDKSIKLSKAVIANGSANSTRKLLAWLVAYDVDGTTRDVFTQQHALRPADDFNPCHIVECGV